MEMITPPIVSLRNASKTFFRGRRDELRVLAGVDLDIGKGEVVGLWGPNGCGKSTLLRAISGLLTLDHPECRNVGDAEPNIGYVPQDVNSSLLLWRAVRKNLMLVNRMSVRDADAHLSGFGFANDTLRRYPSELSGGFRQRLSLACALVPSREIVVLDEPFSAQDARFSGQLVHTIRSVARKGTSVVLTAHDPALLTLSSDRIVVLGPASEGRRSIVDERSVSLDDDGRSVESLDDSQIRMEISYLERYVITHDAS